MQHFQSILAAVRFQNESADGTLLAEVDLHAMEEAILMAQVHDGSVFVPVPAAIAESESFAGWLTEQKSRARVEPFSVDGDVFESLNEIVVGNGIDVVIASAADGEKCATASKVTCPVLLVRSAPADDVPIWLVAVTLDDAGQEVLTQAVNGAQSLEARLIILHAVEETDPPRENDDDAAASGEISWENHPAAGHLYEMLIQTDYRTLVHGVSPVICPGPMANAIAVNAAENAADWVMIGAGDSEDCSAELERILQATDCSILLLR